MRLVVSDDHLGIVKAVQRYFQGSKWQRYQFHFIRNLLDSVSKKERSHMYLLLRGIFDSPDLKGAVERLNEAVLEYQKKYPKIAEKLAQNTEGALTCLSFPPSHRRRIRTTNSLEHFNEEVRRRTRVIRIFPNPDSALRLISALAIERTEEWLTGKRYLNMEELSEGE